MSFKEIEQKLKSGDKFYNRLSQENGELNQRIYNLIQDHSDINDSDELGQIIEAVTDAMGGIQAEAMEAGYNAGVTDTLKEFENAGITDIDLTKWDFSDLEITEADRLEFDRLIDELDSVEIDPTFFDTDFKDFK